MANGPVAAYFLQLRPKKNRNLLEHTLDERAIAPAAAHDLAGLGEVLLELLEMLAGEFFVEDIEIGFIVQTERTVIEVA